MRWPQDDLEKGILYTIKSIACAYIQIQSNVV